MKIPFLRKYSGKDDNSSVHQATLEAISQTESFYGKYDTVIQLMPNCPLRTINIVKML